jgi:hypothetical protein
MITNSSLNYDNPLIYTGPIFLHSQQNITKKLHFGNNLVSFWSLMTDVIVSMTT